MQKINIKKRNSITRLLLIDYYRLIRQINQSKESDSDTIIIVSTFQLSDFAV